MKNVTPPQIVVRLHPEVYLKLEAKFSRPLVTEQTTPITAAYALGVEAVLKELRKNLTYDL